MDRCGCCQVCARSEGQLCDAGDGSKELGLCGENLECAKRDDVPGVRCPINPLDLEMRCLKSILSLQAESVCKCQVQKMVCSNDKTTYPTIW